MGLLKASHEVPRLTNLVTKGPTNVNNCSLYLLFGQGTTKHVRPRGPTESTLDQDKLICTQETSSLSF